MRPLCYGVLALGLSCAPSATSFLFGLQDIGPDRVVVGRPAAGWVVVTTPGGDRRDTRLPAKPSCVVVAPSGAGVDCTVGAWGQPPRDEDNGVARFSFTPLEPGWHEVDLSLAEGGTPVHFRSYAVALVGVQVATLPAECWWVERLASDSWLCDKMILRADAPPQSFGATLVAAAETSVWSFNTGEVRRHVDSAAGYVPEPHARFDTGLFYAYALLATQREVLVIDEAQVVRVGVGLDGELREVARLVFTTRGKNFAAQVGGSLLTGRVDGSQTEVCAYTLEATAISAAGCRRYDGRLWGEGDGGLLLGTAAGLLLVRPWPGDGLTLALPSPYRLGTPAYRGMAILGGGVVPRIEGSSMRLDSFEYAVGASGSLVWGHAGGKTFVYERP